MNVRVPGYESLIETTATRFGLNPDLVGAVVLTESSGLTNAYRYEPAFWLRYMAPRPEWRGRDPHRVSASYGLMQVMFPTALTLGMDPATEPELLFVPAIGMEFGCRVLANLLKWAGGFAAPREAQVRAALAAYNGGQQGNEPTAATLRNAAYVSRVASFLPAGTTLASF
jgi:soluble lytic murein transglycosylase-like protein